MKSVGRNLMLCLRFFVPPSRFEVAKTSKESNTKGCFPCTFEKGKYSPTQLVSVHTRATFYELIKKLQWALYL